MTTGRGESADIVAVRIVGDPAEPSGLEVEFYHCKYSLDAAPGRRVDDLYEVCGRGAEKHCMGLFADERSGPVYALAAPRILAGGGRFPHPIESGNLQNSSHAPRHEPAPARQFQVLRRSAWLIEGERVTRATALTQRHRELPLGDLPVEIWCHCERVNWYGARAAPGVRAISGSGTPPILRRIRPGGEGYRLGFRAS